MSYAAAGTPSSSNPESAPESVFNGVLAHASAEFAWTDFAIATALRTAYPNHPLTVTVTKEANILKFAKAGHASYMPLPEIFTFDNHKFRPAAKRGMPASLKQVLRFAGYMYTWQDKTFTVYQASWPLNRFISEDTTKTYILGEGAHELVLAAGSWGQELHDEIWVFDETHWKKDKQLWEGVQGSSWDDVVLPPGVLEELRSDVEGFFQAMETYTSLGIAWKRGIIFHGPPGNGKTITIKSLINSLRSPSFPSPIPVNILYVKTLTDMCQGPEASLSTVFQKAREAAPCLLVFEDLDSLITDRTRSYFLNEIDGLQSNNGVLMIGSTNHLDRLDVGIVNRPSRFDRKYYFPSPTLENRKAYADYWMHKLEGHPTVRFPPTLSQATAQITEGFTFAYMKEVFVSSLLISAAGRMELPEEIPDPVDVKSEGLEDSQLWRVIKLQVASLRKEMEAATATPEKKSTEKSPETLSEFLEKQGTAN